VLPVTCVLLLAGCGAPTPPSPAPRERPPVIAITGDILLAGRAERLIEEKGPAAPFAEVSAALREADLAIGNLECSLSTRGKRADKKYTFRADPKTVAALSEASFDVMTLANNHSVDYGPEALTDTLQTLREAGIAVVGAGEDAERARQPVIVARGEPPVKIAVLAFSNMEPVSFYAGRNRPGTNPAQPDAIRESVSRARRQADVVIALFHWGDEHSISPTARQRELAYLAADAGADLVVGHHPHVLQGFERRGSALIAYSLGNFLFPSRGACRSTMMLRYSPRRDGRAMVEVIPCVIEGFRPRPARQDERAECMTRLPALSRPLGAEMPDRRGVITMAGRASSVDSPLRAP
jgi:poly-gamma-glutamate synthesis protein (capsule biosynthesis protein)